MSLELKPLPGFQLLGNTAPGSPIGDVHVSDLLIAQIGLPAAREQVRRIYDSTRGYAKASNPGIDGGSKE